MLEFTDYTERSELLKQQVKKPFLTPVKTLFYAIMIQEQLD